MQLRGKIRIRLPLRAISTPGSLNSAKSSTFLEYLSSTDSKLVTTTSGQFNELYPHEYL